MFRRISKLSKNNSFFLFGPRGCGKSTHLKTQFSGMNSLYIDLLEGRYETRYRKSPDLLMNDIEAAGKNIKWVIIDEVQKIPKLLDIVHKLIEEKKIHFALTGSSARKLKRGDANLLAGRAFVLHMHPLTYQELGKDFDLAAVLQYGSLPKIFSYDDPQDKIRFLNSYVESYLKEEILQEQIVRNIDGFHSFLEVAAQMSGKSINFSKISRESGVDPKTVKEYFQVLDDTLIGFWLNGFHKSVRKAQVLMPKFYFFDVGVCRSLEGALDSRPVPGTSYYGHCFENYVMAEIYRFNLYSEKKFKMSHYQLSTGGEIDLILSKGKQLLVVEIKSTNRVDSAEVRAFSVLAKAFGDAPKYFISLDPVSSVIDGVHCMRYEKFIEKIFGVLLQ